MRQDGDLPLLRLEDLEIRFGETSPVVSAYGASIYARQTLAVVGESGCGKSVTALSVLRLLPSSGRVSRGSIFLNGRNLLTLPEHEMLKVRGGEVAMIFQEPMTSLNPVFTVGDQIIEAILLHQKVTRSEARERAAQAMLDVGITNPQQRLRAYPHQFSGGMRQRVMIAMALACQPSLLLADEPTTALDVTIQAQILELLGELKEQRAMGVMLITHDLGVVAQHADVVCVMYAGRVVEYARVYDVFENPLHPYTKALLRCRPSMHDAAARLPTVSDFIGNQDDALIATIGGETINCWWPHDRQRASDDGYALRELEPQHWVACRDMPVSGALLPPDIAWRRPMVAA